MIAMQGTITSQAKAGFQMGAEKAVNGETTARGLVDGAFTLLFVLIVLAVTALVGGEFIGAMPSNGTFNESMTTLEDNSGTSITLFAVGLLVIPAAAVVGYLYTQMGGVIGMGGGRRGR